jgi:hypothetical protein
LSVRFRRRVAGNPPNASCGRKCTEWHAQREIFTLDESLDITPKEHTVASKAMIGRLPGGVVRFILQKHIGELAVSAPCPQKI